MENTQFDSYDEYSQLFTQIAEDCGYITAAWHQLKLGRYRSDLARLELAISVDNAMNRWSNT
jgi:hypothetical protein